MIRFLTTLALVIVSSAALAQKKSPPPKSAPAAGVSGFGGSQTLMTSTSNQRATATSRMQQPGNKAVPRSGDRYLRR